MKRPSAKNLAYLKSITDKLDQLPLFILRRAALYTFEGVIKANLSKGFDSGQAAANWRMEGYTGGPTYEAQKMLWGYALRGEALVEPTAPVGFKKNSKGREGGNPEEVMSYQLTYALTQAGALTKGVTGVTIYNPITSGFSGFSPGSDAGYEENAFAGVSYKLISIAADALSRAELEAEAFLRRRNANPI